ncbi:MAG: Fe(2+) transporter permease subunit FeoB [Vibrionaceae bacterium]
MYNRLFTVGNPNSGKTTFFNQLAGTRQAVGNWDGVTIEKKTGVAILGACEIQLTDLPGVYSLETDGSISQDEQIAASEINAKQYDLLLNIVDASTLERSLYLTLQLRELGRPMVVILNKIDQAHQQGYQIDLEKLSAKLGCPVLAVCSKSAGSVKALKSELAQLMSAEITTSALNIEYGAELEEALTAIAQFSRTPLSKGECVQLLLADQKWMDNSPAWQARLAQIRSTITENVDVELLLAEHRYSQVADIYRACHINVQPLSRKLTDLIDNIVLHKIAGLPIFLVVMYLMFMFSINVGSAFIDFFDIAVGALLVDAPNYWLQGVLPAWLLTLLADGFGAGIQTVATFIPVISCLYLFMSLLESSGYMARAAFLLDKLMQRIGLPGKAFVPLVLGFGCNVPAIMATRTLEQERERQLAAAMTPFMSCGARLPVYALFAAALFPQSGQNVVFALYLFGIAAALFTGFVLRNTLFFGKSTPLMMTLPSYELPRAKDIAFKTWHKLSRFILGAGKTIVLVITLLSFFNSLGSDGSFGNQNTSDSLLSKAAQFITPAFKPIGINEDNWPATVGIITGIFAKEAVVGTLNSLYLASEEEGEEAFSLQAKLLEAVHTVPENLLGINLADPLGISVGDLSGESVAEEQGVDQALFANISSHFTTASALAYLVFILLYTPCVAAMGAYVREFGQPFALFVAGWTMVLAYVGATLTYQLQMLTVTPLSSTLWCLAVIGVQALVIWLLKRSTISKKVFMACNV